MVFLIGLAAAVSLGTGYVLQQRVAARAEVSPPLSLALLRQVLRRRLWWLGLATMMGGQALGSWALGISTLALVEPLLSTSLLVAFALSAALGHHAPRWQEVLGTVLLGAALGVFLGLSDPRAAPSRRWDLVAVAAAAGAVGAVALALVTAARRRSLAAEAVLIAVASGTLYGLQDVGTRGALRAYESGGFPATVQSPWPYIVAATGLCGLILTQSAYRAGRLDYSLPPTTATEPVVGILLGVGVLGDRLSVNPVNLLIDSLCIVALVGGVALIARSPALGPLSGAKTPLDAGGR